MLVRRWLLASLLAVSGCASPPEDPALARIAVWSRSLRSSGSRATWTSTVSMRRATSPGRTSGERPLRRLENFESLIEDPRFRPALRFAQAECREHLADFAGAAALWREVAALPGPRRRI
jgi:hypothetical protein